MTAAVILSSPPFEAARPGRAPLRAIAAWELAGLAVLAFAETAALISGTPAAADTVNLGGPAVLGALLSLGAFRLVRRDPDRLWSPLVAFRIATALYFGVGQLVPLAADAATRDALDQFYQVFAPDLVKVNLVVAVGALLVLATSALCARLLSAGRPEASRRAAVVDGAASGRLLLVSLLFLTVGGAARLALQLPVELGVDASALSGAGGALANLLPVGIYTLAAWRFERGRGALAVAAVLAIAAADAAVGVLTFSKAAALLPVLMLLLAWLHRRPTGGRLVVAVAAAATLYAAVSPVVSYGRAELVRRYGDITGAPLGERLAIAADYVSQRPDAPTSGEEPSRWARLSYANQAAFAIAQHDAGAPGDSLAHAGEVLIPRFAWRDKPVITDVGTEFNFLATGSAASSSSPGLFAEAYWNFGWLGLPLLMIPLGVLLHLWDLYAGWVLRRGRWLFLPVVLFGVRMGARVDGAYVADVIGATAVAAGLHLGLAVLDRLLLESARRRAGLAT